MKMNRMYEKWGFLIKVCNIRRNKHIYKMHTGPEWKNPILWDNVCAQISIFVCLYAHSSSSFCLFSAEYCPSQAHLCQGAPCRPGCCRWYLPGEVISMGIPCVVDRCHIWSKLLFDLQKSGSLWESAEPGMLEGGKGKILPSFVCICTGLCQPRSVGSWGCSEHLGDPFRGLAGQLNKIRAVSKLYLHGQLSLILDIMEDELKNLLQQNFSSTCVGAVPSIESTDPH